MQNRIVGSVILGIAVLIGVIIFMFNRALYKMLDATCSHGPSCSMWDTLGFQTGISVVMMVFVVLIGLYLVILGDKDLISKIFKKRMQKSRKTKNDYKDVLQTLAPEEKKVFELIIAADGSIFQSELVDKSQISKVKISRILDKLEGRNLIMRKRHGMTNVVILKRE